EPAPASSVQYQYEGVASFHQINETLREIDVHPPLYFWGVSLWRRWFGSSIEVIRGFSIACSLATILTMYALLKAGRIDRPIVPLLFYAMLTGPAFWETTARPYGLAILLITVSALFAYLAVEAAPRQFTRAGAYSVIMAIACGAAFQTQYVTI